MSDLEAWLDGRRPTPPPSLRAAVLEAIRRADPGHGPLVERLAAAGMEALARVVAAPSTRDRALELLAADALLTYACEAALEEGAAAEPAAAGPTGLDGRPPGPVDRLAHVVGGDRFAALLAAVEAG